MRGLRKTYGAGAGGLVAVRALRGVDLTVGRGEFVALMGPSGCGKSTLLHLLTGLDRADEGAVELAGTCTDDLGAAALARLRRRHVGLVFRFFHLIEHMSALENVALAALVAGDEPTGALDSEGQGEVLDLFGRLHAAGQTILLVTHSHEVAGAAERVVQMRDGRIVDDGGYAARERKGWSEPPFPRTGVAG